MTLYRSSHHYEMKRIILRIPQTTQQQSTASGLTLRKQLPVGTQEHQRLAPTPPPPPQPAIMTLNPTTVVRAIFPSPTETHIWLTKNITAHHIIQILKEEKHTPFKQTIFQNPKPMQMPKDNLFETKKMKQ